MAWVGVVKLTYHAHSGVFDNVAEKIRFRMKE